MKSAVCVGLFLLLSVSAFTMLINPSMALVKMTVKVLVVGDEEYRDHAQSFFGHFTDWKTLSDFQMTLSQWLFDANYSIKLEIGAWREWQSEPTTNMTILMQEAEAETGFVTGQGFDMLVIFTGQDCTSAGKAWREKGIVIVFDGWTYLWEGYDYAVDNIMAHEISHLYQAPDHYPYGEGYYYCLLSNGDAGLTSTIWCSGCFNTIMAHRTAYGIPPSEGGGSGRFTLGC